MGTATASEQTAGTGAAQPPVSEGDGARVREERRRARRYLPTAALFAIGVGALIRPTARRTTPPKPLEQVQLALSTYFLARLVAREKMGSVVRAPILSAAEGEEEDPGLLQMSSALADLVTCTRCVGVWAAAGLVTLRSWAPREAGVVMPLLTAAGANNLLQAAHSVLAECANDYAARPKYSSNRH
jgi:hypothetical protein